MTDPSWIIAVANENGYFPTAQQAAHVWASLPQRTRQHYRRGGSRPATAAPESEVHFAFLMFTIAGVMASKTKPQAQ